MLALWTLVLLGVMAAALGAHVSTHMTVAWDLSNRSACYHAAKAGVEAAVAEVRQGTNAETGLSQPWVDNPRAMKDVAVGEGIFTVFHTVRGADGVLRTNYGVADEEGKVNVNAVTNPAVYGLVMSLIRTAGGADETKAESITECISDWIDADDQPRENGAENGWYKGQNPSYECHNGRLDRVEELLLVKGMDADIYARIAGHLTVYGTNIGVNINTADPAVLQALAMARKGIQQADAEGFVKKILAFREGGGVLTSLDRRKIRMLLYGERGVSDSERGEWAVLGWLLNHHLIAVQSRYFCGMSIGRLSRGSAAERRIAFVFDSDTGVMKAWNEE